MIALLALAASALTPQSAQDIRCVAVLGVVSYEQGREGEWGDMAPVRAEGERFAGVVGARVMKETGQSREAVKALILGDVAAFQKAKDLTRPEVERCLARLAVVAPEPALPRCAALMAIAADTVKRREGLSKGAKDLATLAAVLDYRARTEGTATGKTEAQVADAIAAERAAAAKAGDADAEELQGCAELAAAE